MTVTRKEIDILKEKFNTAFHSGKGATILISGEDGVGKSHLITQFIAGVVDENKYNPKLKVLFSSATCDGRFINLDPFKELIINLEYNIALLNEWNGTKIEPEVDYKKVVRNVYESHGTDWIKLIPVVGSYAAELIKTVKTINRESEAQKAASSILIPARDLKFSNNDDIFVQLMRKFRNIADEHILILFFKDIHFFDDSSLELFFSISKNLSGMPFRLILTGTYSEEDLTIKKLDPVTGSIINHPLETALSNLRKLNAFEKIKLERFNQIQVKEFFNLRFPKNEFAEEFIHELGRATNGNAFFLEEIIKNLKDKGSIYEDEGVSRNKEYDDYSELPVNIEEVIRIRYEGLLDDLKLILDCASVMGNDFSAEIIARILGEDLDKNINMKIRKLKDNYKIVEPVDKNYFKLEMIYKFVHNLFRRFVYNILIEEKLIYRYHLKIAEAIEEFFPDEKINIVMEQYNLHLGIGNRILSYDGRLMLNKSDLDDKERKEAVEKYLETCKKLIAGYEKTFSNSENIRRCRIVTEIAILTGNKKMECEYREKLGNVLMRIGKWDESENQLMESLKVSESMLDKKAIASVKLSLGNLMRKKGSYNNALNYFESSHELFKEADVESGILSSRLNIAHVHSAQGRYDNAIEYYNNVLDKYNQSGYSEGVAEINSDIGIIHYNKGDFKLAEEYYSKSLKISEEINDKMRTANATARLAGIRLANEKFSEANDFYLKSLGLYREIGDLRRIAEINNNIGVVNFAQGNFESASRYYSDAHNTYLQLGDKNGIAFTGRNLGLICQQRGELDNALKFFTSALEINLELEDKLETARSFFDIGDIYKDRGDNVNAEKYYDKAIELARELKINSILSSFLYSKAVLKFNSGQTAAAAVLNEEALEIAKSLGKKNIIYYSSILSEKINALKDKAGSISSLKKMLEEYKEDYQSAELNYEIFKLENSAEYKTSALKLFTSLFEKTPKAEYKKIIEELS